MKKKKTSLKKRILALVVVCLMVTLSIIPCFGADTNAHSIVGVPVYFGIAYHPYYETSYLQGYDYKQFGGVILPSDYEYSVHNSYSRPYSIMTVRDLTSTSTSRYIRESSELVEFPDALHYYVDYELIAGNFFINPSQDDFSFDITVNQMCIFETTMVYTILDDTSNGSYETYVSITDTAIYSFSFSLNDFFVDLGFDDDDIYVYSLNIRYSTDPTTFGVNTSIVLDENDTFIERNTNVFDLYLDGEINLSDSTNSFYPFERFFKALGVEDYKSVFENYTADYTSWIGNAVSGFLNMEIMPFFSFGGVLLIIIATGLVLYFLKVFMGG